MTLFTILSQCLCLEYNNLELDRWSVLLPDMGRVEVEKAVQLLYTGSVEGTNPELFIPTLSSLFPSLSLQVQILLCKLWIVWRLGRKEFNLNFLFPLSLQPDGENLSYFKLVSFDLKKIFLWKSEVHDIGFRKYRG